MVSIIIPVYNAERFLKECVDSVLNQTYTDMELLLIDDGSSDTSGEICDIYAEADHRVRAIHQENAGVCAARNRGIDLSQGDYIIFVDADDVVSPYMVERYMTSLESTGADICVSEYTYHIEDIQQLSIQPVRVYSAKDALHNALTLKIFNLTPWAQIIRKSVLNGLYFSSDIKIAEDILFDIQLFTSVTKIAYLPERHYYYRYSPEWSTTSNNYEEKVKTALTAFDEMEKIILNKMPDLLHDLELKKCRDSLFYINKMIKLQIPADSPVYQEFCCIIRKDKKLILTDATLSMKTKCAFILFLLCPSAYGWLKRFLYQIKIR